MHRQVIVSSYLVVGNISRIAKSLKTACQRSEQDTRREKWTVAMPSHRCGGSMRQRGRHGCEKRWQSDGRKVRIDSNLQQQLIE